ncbi:hypothetical protein PCH_Pc22g10360 [Penicillium rubens Wisconsin 54-1255]|uniref:Uncharacterized protein n=1 Tax=Penicillium rubens (strain ATCC 28089 / DSM 1075 / NRRL 1951 / Wisconsin 54-1255) TaxID=500485 RepID=B6HVL1_PENRW|nr:hypothetical protein PCH_Pc22g10360 [Penicillium rubens Wisconsin 54-1255]
MDREGKEETEDDRLGLLIKSLPIRILVVASKLDALRTLVVLLELLLKKIASGLSRGESRLSSKEIVLKEGGLSRRGIALSISEGIARKRSSPPIYTFLSSLLSLSSLITLISNFYSILVGFIEIRIIRFAEALEVRGYILIERLTDIFIDNNSISKRLSISIELYILFIRKDILVGSKDSIIKKLLSLSLSISIKSPLLFNFPELDSVLLLDEEASFTSSSLLRVIKVVSIALLPFFRLKSARLEYRIILYSVRYYTKLLRITYTLRVLPTSRSDISALYSIIFFVIYLRRVRKVKRAYKVALMAYYLKRVEKYPTFKL